MEFGNLDITSALSQRPPLVKYWPIGWEFISIRLHEMKNHGIMGYSIVPCHPLELIRTSRLILPPPYPLHIFCSLPLFSLFLILLFQSAVLLQPPLFLSRCFLLFHSQVTFYSKNHSLPYVRI